MGNIITRKCAKCKKGIEIDVNNIVGVIYYKKLYYHKECFCNLCEQRMSSKRGKPQEWEEAFNNLLSLEIDTKKLLENYFAKEELNCYLLTHYDVAVVPTRFWQMVADLERGVYKGKQCKPIEMRQLLSMWQWGQNRLDKIAANNKTKRVGPSNGDDRIRYDFAILLSHTNDFIKYTQRSKEEAYEIAERVKNAKKFNYEKIYEQSSRSEEKTDSILDLMNDIF